MKEKTVFKHVVISGAFLSFVVLAGTGILKYKKISQFLPISSQTLPLEAITTYHEYAALFLGIFVLLHFIIQKAWFEYIIKTIFSGKRIFLLIGSIIALVIFLSYPGRKNNINQLAAVEIKNYHGENLSSIKDFRENSIKGPQYVDIKNYRLEISGLVNQPYNLFYNEALKQTKYSKLITLNCVEGWSVKILWEGILLKDLIAKARPKKEVKTVIFHAYDGYTSSLSLDYIENKNILLAYKINGIVLPAERGFPFQVAAEDKWGYKWVKWVTKIELSDDPDYKGYWEKSGYNNNGDVNGPKFEE